MSRKHKPSWNPIPAKIPTVTNNIAILSKVRIINAKNNTSHLPSSHHQWQEPLMTVINGKNHWWRHCQCHWPNRRPTVWNTPALHAQITSLRVPTIIPRLTSAHFVCVHAAAIPSLHHKLWQRLEPMYETDWTAELLLLESATIMGCKGLHHDHVVV